MSDYQENAFGGRLYAQGLYEESAVQKHRLGTIRELDDGRKFVYAQDSGAGVAAGTAVAKDTAPQACTVAAADAAINLAGARTITVTLTGTPTLNLYRDGMMVITLGAGVGEIYKIKGNSADDDPASGRCTLYLYDALATLHVAANTTIDIYANPYDGVIINPAVTNIDGTGTGSFQCLGVAQRIVTASYYYWLQTWGLASAMIIASTAGGEDDERGLWSSATAGSLESVTAAANGLQQLGFLAENSDQDNAEAALVYLTIS